MSTTREMNVQRSIGKRILAVVAGVGLMVSGAAIAAPGAQADSEQAFQWPTQKDWTDWADDGSEAQENRLNNGIAKEAECKEQEFYNCALETRNRVSGGKDQSSYRVTGYSADQSFGESVGESIEAPAPPPCWSANNCPVGGAIQVSVPQYMIEGMPQQLIVYASWRPDENTAGAPTNGDAVISMDGEPVAAAAFADGKATFSFTPTEPGLKDVVISGVLNSNTSGANAWIDSVEAATMVLPYDPEILEEALKNKKVEVGQTYTLQEIAQAKTALGKRVEWRVAQDSSDVCAVTTTKKGEVKAKFTESGKCSIIWTDPKTDEDGKYTFKVTA